MSLEEEVIATRAPRLKALVESEIGLEIEIEIEIGTGTETRLDARAVSVVETGIGTEKQEVVVVVRDVIGTREEIGAVAMTAETGAAKGVEAGIENGIVIVIVQGREVEVVKVEETRGGNKLYYES